MDSDQEGITVSVTGHGSDFFDDCNYDNLTCNLSHSIFQIGAAGSSSPYLFSNTAPTGSVTLDDTVVWGNGWGQPEGKLSLRGEDADIDINGVSLMTTIKEIGDRLNMLCPDPEMEQEWDQLRELREQYEAKLQECREKSRAWKALQQKG
jgi:hypothetical protein